MTNNLLFELVELFHDGGRYHIETSPWTGFYMITASVVKELSRFWKDNNA